MRKNRKVNVNPITLKGFLNSVKNSRYFDNRETFATANLLILAAPTAMIEKVGDNYRIKGTYHGFKIEHIPGDAVDKVYPKDYISYEANLFKTETASKTAPVKDLVAAYALPEKVVKVLGNNIDFCHFFFVLGECVKNKTYVPSIWLIHSNVFEKLRENLSCLPKNFYRQFHLNPYGIDETASSSLSDYIKQCSVKEIVALSNYVISLLETDEAAFIPKEITDACIKKLEEELKKETLEKNIALVVKEYDFSSELATILKGDYYLARFVEDFIKFCKNYLRGETDVLAVLRAALTGSNHSTKKESLTKLFEEFGDKGNKEIVTQILEKQHVVEELAKKMFA